IKYQSVQGVTINITNPIHKLKWSFKRSKPNRYANIGVHIKLITRFADMNLRLENPASRFLMGIFKNKPKSITMRKGTIRYSAKLLIAAIWPRSKPRLTAIAMINV